MAGAFYPWILASKSERNDPVLMNHERIHLSQEKGLFVIPFYIMYALHGFWLMIKYLSLQKSYLMNRFEAEAFANQEDLAYVVSRHRFGWGGGHENQKTLDYLARTALLKTGIADRIVTVLFVIIIAVFVAAFIAMAILGVNK